MCFRHNTAFIKNIPVWYFLCHEKYLKFQFKIKKCFWQIGRAINRHGSICNPRPLIQLRVFYPNIPPFHLFCDITALWMKIFSLQICQKNILYIINEHREMHVNTSFFIRQKLSYTNILMSMYICYLDVETDWICLFKEKESSKSLIVYCTYLIGSIV